jgi:hypothetical protein
MASSGNVAPCGSCKNRHSGGTCRLHVHGGKITGNTASSSLILSTLKIGRHFPVALVRADVSEELTASIMSVERIGELGTLALIIN